MPNDYQQPGATTAPNTADADTPSVWREARAPGPVTTEQPLPATVSSQLTINGIDHPVQLTPWMTLLDVLREQLHLYGTKKGCDHGQCGACTVLINGERINACLQLAMMQEGKAITTIEGLANGKELHPMQEAFIRHDAFQCGYCTAGQVMSAVGLVQEGCPADQQHIREGMSGNLCRCGAYANIVAAVQEILGAQDASATPQQAEHPNRKD